jgi:hypothetical protein
MRYRSVSLILCRTQTTMAQFADSQLFATTKAPYIKYLEHIKSEWPEADSLDETLKKLTSLVKRYHEPVPTSRNARTGEFVNVAEILDIHDDVNGKNNVIKPLSPSLGAYKDLTLPDPRAIENFLSRLRSCESSVHTRVIVLHSGRGAPGDRAADGLFFCHVLGVELDLPPTDVRNLAQLDRLNDGYVQAAEQPRQRLPMKPGFVSLGFSPETRKRSVAAYIGRRKIGTASPHIGELTSRLASFKYHTDGQQSWFACRLASMSRIALFRHQWAASGNHQLCLHTRNISYFLPETHDTKYLPLRQQCSSSMQYGALCFQRAL